METQKSKGRKKGRRNSGSQVWIAIMATIISLCALLTSLYQAMLDREQQRASVWPYVMITMSNVNPNNVSEPFFEISLMNKGVGPAIVKSIAYNFQEKSVENPYQLISEIFPKTEFFIISDIWQGRVISPGETVQHIVLKGAQAEKMDSLSRYLKIQIQYKSVFDDIWLSRFNTGDENLVIKLEP